MSQHHNVYSQKGCVGCKPCEGGAGNIGRNATLWGIGLMTAGIGLLVVTFTKKCVYCGHRSFMNAHRGVDARVGV